MTTTLAAPTAETLEVAYENTKTLDQMTAATSDSPLTGDALLDAYKANKNASAHDLCKLTGYYSINKKGKEVCNIAGMQKAMLVAMDVNIGTGGASAKGRGGRKLSYTARVQGNGNLLVGNAYTAMLELEPGSEFTIKMSKNSGIIRLVPAGTDVEEGDEG